MCFHENRLNLVIVVLGLRNIINCSLWLNYVVDGIVMTCFCCSVVNRTLNHCSKSFWVFGGSKRGFGWVRGCEIV